MSKQESQRILGRDEPGVFDHDLETLGSVKTYGTGINQFGGPATFQGWLEIPHRSADPVALQEKHKGRTWFDKVSKLFKFWDGTKILTIAPMQWFIDNFDGASLHWAWGENNVAAGKTITLAGGLLTIAVAGTTDGNWTDAVNNAPKALMGVPGYPCEVIAKLNSYTVNDDTMAGLFVSYNATGTGAQTTMSINRHRNDSTPINGLAVHRITTGVLASNAVTTLPIWLRIRIGNASYYAGKIIFSYSTDGETYTDLYTLTPGTWPVAAGNAMVVGLFARNWGVFNAIAAPFESFSAAASYGPG